MAILSVLLLLLLLLPIGESADPPAYTAVDLDLILVNCGASTNFTDRGHRNWNTGDTYLRNVQEHSSSRSKASYMHPSVPDLVPYQTAQVFQSPSTYSFPVSTGHKFIRLYFYPDTYAGYSTSQSYFSVTANGFTLLSNFSAFLHYMSHTDKPSFSKEFIIEVKGDQRIDLTFYPNQNSFAFINGIEIVSIPNDLYFRESLIKYVSMGSVSDILQNDIALETLYRLNVGGSEVHIEDDSGTARGMFRSWRNDDAYIVGSHGYTPHDEKHPIKYTTETPPYSAPKTVYRTSRVISNGTKRLDWVFPVDSGFYYLLRLHFCEIQLEITMQNQRVFNIEIDNKTAEIQADVFFWTNGNGIPIFKDYITWVSDDGHRGKKGLWLSLFPNIEGSPLYSNALLNGLEMFKLNDSGRSLAAANPDPSPPASASEKKEKGKSSVIVILIGSVSGVVVVIAALSFLLLRWRLKLRDSITEEQSGLKLERRTSGLSGTLLSGLCRHFSLEEIRIATHDFNDNLLIGSGGFGNVYKGFFNNGTIIVAVKRLHSSSNQGAQEFLMEIELLSKLRHLHLVSLIGYSDENGEMILVYDYMSHGTLRDHLYDSNNHPLSWKHRLHICLGAAKGLHYLHSGTEQVIIHRDVKPTNILLDENWVAKVSDFGLSKVGPANASNTHVSTAVKGTFGYVDPEYFILQQLTDKSDVYSFGVVLLEVLCARPVILPGPFEEQVNLAKWAKICYRNGTIDQIVDSNLKDQITPECLNKFVETAIICLKGNRTKRPPMTDVVRNLELAMQLQEGSRESDNWTSGESASWSHNKSLHTLKEIFSELSEPSGR